MADLLLLEELQDYLIAQGVGQHPSATPSAVLPGIYLTPRDGSPLPRFPQGETMTVTLIDTGVGSPGDLEAWIEETFVDIIVRSQKAPAGKLTHRVIRGLLHPITAHGGRKMWAMGALDPVECSSIWRQEQPLPPPIARGGGVTEVKTFDRVASYRFRVRRKVLAGFPTVP